MTRMEILVVVVLLMFIVHYCGSKQEKQPENFKTITVTVRPNQTLWEIANKFFKSNPYGYDNFSDYYDRLLTENRHLINKERPLKIGYKITIKLARK